MNYTKAMPGLTKKEIDSITDAGEAIGKGIDHDIDMTGLDTFEEMIERLKCHLRLQEEGSYKLKVRDKILYNT